MKTLDDQVPSGYFEGLPNRTLARLGEDSSMQTSGSTSNQSSPTGVPPQEREEDSGLHDIRSMASSAKMRISSRRISTSPPVDEDVLASSSAGWKAVALPEPARMVSLPELDQLPSVEEVKSKRDSKKELKAERASAKKIATEAVAVETVPVSSPSLPSLPAPVADVAATPIIGARFAQQQQKSRTGLYAVLGLGLAAAAGVGFYVVTNKTNDAAAPSQVAMSSDTAPRGQAAVAPATVPVAAATNGAAAGSGAAVAAPEPPKAEETKLAIATDEGVAGQATDKTDSKADDRPHKDHKAGAVKKKDEKNVETPPAETKPDPKDKAQKDSKDGKKAGGDENEPSFDALLKEAGVPDKKPEKQHLEKKSLSGGDIKTGMSSVAGKAQACYAGTQGTAAVKLTVAPDGTVQKVTVTGVFAGTPVGACVEAAVKGAKFPAWEGGPQSFGYSYLLAE